MNKISDFIERNPVQAIIALLLFHIALACIMSWLAHSPYLSHLHDGKGFWEFAIDSTLYHKEAIYFIDVLNSEGWDTWWSGSFPGQLSNHAHTKWIGLLYWVAGKETPLLFELVNSVTWVASVILIFLASRTLFKKNKTIAVYTVLYLFFPSTLLSSTQLLRDPFYILGFCFAVYGWVAIFHEDSKWKGVLAILTGFYLISSIRLYVTPVMLFSFSVCAIIFVLGKKIPRFPTFIILIGISFITFQANHSNSAFYELKEVKTSKTENKNEKTEGPLKFFQDRAIEIFMPTEKQSKKDLIDNVKIFSKNFERYESTMRQAQLLKRTDYSGPVGYIRYLDKKLALRLSLFRAGFGTVNWYSHSGIDRSVQFTNIGEVFSYLPRALQIGFLSPFPHIWFSSGSATGHVGRIIAGVETLVMYIIFVGFFSAFFIEKEIFKPVAPILIFSTVIIVLLGLVVPNMGAIYRMRQGLFIPFFMIGVYGLRIFSIKFKNKIFGDVNDWKQ